MTDKETDTEVAGSAPIAGSASADDATAGRTRVLVIGATGYVGSRLVPALLERNVAVTVGARDPGKVDTFPWHGEVTTVQLDVFDPDTLDAATQSGDVIFYLVHSMDGDNFVERDHRAAVNLADAARRADAARIVYLSGLIPGDTGPEELSDHLYSRLDVERVFTASPVRSVTLRAAIIIGAGSASFEMLRQLSERLPFVPLPSWLSCDVQPISIADLIEHLVTTGLSADDPAISIDVGGPTVMRYGDLVAAYCTTAGLRRWFIPLPFIPHRFVGVLAGHFVDLGPSLVQSLIDSLGHPMICRSDRSELIGPTTPEAAMAAALAPRASSTTDPHVLQPYDADWAGGDIEIVDDHPQRVVDRDRLPSAIEVPVLVVVASVAVGLTVLRALPLRRNRRRPVDNSAPVWIDADGGDD